MTTCPHCKSENNNFYYCRGCGRKIPLSPKPEKRKESSSSDFIEEVIDIIESKFISSDFTMTNIANMGSISLDEISKEEGIILLGNEQWQEIPRRQQCACFFGETVSIYLMSAIITMIGFIAGANDVRMVFQLYASAFLLLSFTEWLRRRKHEKQNAESPYDVSFRFNSLHFYRTVFIFALKIKIF